MPPRRCRVRGPSTGPSRGASDTPAPVRLCAPVRLRAPVQSFALVSSSCPPVQSLALVRLCAPVCFPCPPALQPKTFRPGSFGLVACLKTLRSAPRVPVRSSQNFPFRSTCPETAGLRWSATERWRPATDKPRSGSGPTKYPRTWRCVRGLFVLGNRSFIGLRSGV